MERDDRALTGTAPVPGRTAGKTRAEKNGIRIGLARRVAMDEKTVR